MPFTPAAGPRLLVAADAANPDAVRRALAEGLRALCDRIGASSVHVTFAEEADIAALTDRGYLHRTDQQFHFHNEGYGSYEDFLGTLASRKRKALKRERREALENGISVEWLDGQRPD